MDFYNDMDIEEDEDEEETATDEASLESDDAGMI